MNRTTQKIGSLLGTIVMTFLLVTLSTTSAHAALAGGTVISNTAHVDWAEDGTGTGLDSPPATVTVKLVSGLVWDDTSLSSYTQTVAPGAVIVAYTVDLLNTGNGATTVALTDNTVDDANLDGTDAFLAAATGPNDLTLAATISTATGVFGAGQTVIPVSYIDTANLIDGVTRFHINGSTATYFTVDAGATTSTSLVLNGDASAINAAGFQIGEVVQVTYSGTVAALSSGTSGNHDHALLADDDAGGNLNVDGNASASDTISSDQDAGAGNDWLTVVAIGDLAVAKYVRNNTSAGDNPAGFDIQYNGINYWVTGVTGDAGDVLEYLVVISNTGVGVATDVVMSDPLSSFVALTSTISLDTTGNETFDIADAVGASTATFVSPLMTVYAGVGGTTVGPVGGDIAATPGKTAILFQATIQ
jgi:uncharacterized repeat protein (TIGR01451 family)